MNYLLYRVVVDMCFEKKIVCRHDAVGDASAHLAHSHLIPEKARTRPHYSIQTDRIRGNERPFGVVRWSWSELQVTRVDL